MKYGSGPYLKVPAMLAALVVQGCETPTEFSDIRIEAFAARAGLPNTIGPYYFTRLGDYDLQSFTMGFGEILDCPALFGSGGDSRAQECRSGIAYGVRLGDRVGWLQLEEDGLNLAEGANHFDITRPDDPILSGELWDELQRQDATLYHTYFKGRIVRDSETPLAVLHRVADELPDWMWPPAGHLLLDNPRGVADRSLVDKLAALPVFQGDPYADVRARAASLLEQ